MVAMIVTVMGYANETPFTFNVNKSDQKVTIRLGNVKQGNLLSIKGIGNITLYKEHIEKEGDYAKVFDLESLPDGNYYFELNKDIEITEIPFSVFSGKVIIKKALSKTIFKPITVVKGNQVHVSKLSLNKLPLKVDIYFIGDNPNDEYELVYSKTLDEKQTKSIEKIFKFDDLDTGQYKIVYHCDSREYVELID